MPDFLIHILLIFWAKVSKISLLHSPVPGSIEPHLPHSHTPTFLSISSLCVLLKLLGN